MAAPASSDRDRTPEGTDPRYCGDGGMPTNLNVAPNPP
jgi:hypothetical protein